MNPGTDPGGNDAPEGWPTIDVNDRCSRIETIAQQQPTVDYRGVTRTTRAAARPPMEMAVLPQRDLEIEPTEVAA